MDNEKVILTKEEQREFIKQIASDPEHRKAFCEARADVVLPLLNITSTARTAFKTEDLGPVAEPKYTVSMDDVEMAFIAPKITGVPMVQLELDEIFVQIFAIVAGYEFREELAQDGRTNLPTMADEQLYKRVRMNEELAAWNMIKAVVAHASFPANHTKEIGTSGNGTYSTSTGEGYLSRWLINDILTQSRADERRVDNLWCSPTSYGDIRDWIPTNISPNVQDKILSAAGINSIYNITITEMDNAKLVGDDEVYAIDTRTFGVMPIREEFSTKEKLTSRERFHYGIYGRERVGLGVMDYLALVKGTIDRA